MTMETALDARRLFCGRCRKRARYVGGQGLAPPLRKAVHKATNSETCADGDLIAPVDELPGRDAELLRMAAEVEAEFAVTVTVVHGFLYATRPDPFDPVHWEGDDADDLRREIPKALRRQEAGR